MIESIPEKPLQKPIGMPTVLIHSNNRPIYASPADCQGKRLNWITSVSYYDDVFLTKELGETASEGKVAAHVGATK